MTKNRKHFPTKLGAVLLILAVAAALLSGSALAYLPPSSVYETVTQGVNSYVQLASYFEYTVDYTELGTGAYPPGMMILESGDTVALTGTPTQAGTFTGNGTVFYRSDTGGSDEQAEFTFTIVVEASATPTPAATAAPTAKPDTSSTAATAKPTATPVSVPKVTKSPTGETVTEGSSCIFIARADGATGYTWYCTAADGSVYTMAQAKTSFPGLSVSGDGTTTLTLSNIPASLSGASFYCNFSNSAGDVKSGSATVTVTKATPKPSAKPTEAPDEPVNQNTHDHTFHSEWSYDEEAHWHDCDCGSRDGYEPHRVSDWATKSDGSLLGVCDVCGASVSAAGDTTAAPEATPEATPETTSDEKAEKDKPTLDSGKTTAKKGSALTVLLVVLLVVLLLLLGAIVFFILRSRRASQPAPRSRIKPENEAYNPRHDGINDEYDRQEYERRKNAEHDHSVQ